MRRSSSHRLRPIALLLASVVLVVLVQHSIPGHRAVVRIDAGTGAASPHAGLTGIAMGGPWTWLDHEQQAQDLDALVALGVNWIRVSFPWSSMQFASDRHDWSVHDAIVGMAKERGLSVIANVAFTPGWAQPIDCPMIHCPPASPEKFAEFVGAAVARYSAHGVETWEIWNEPNLPTFWRSGPDPEAYAELLALAHDAAKEADQSVTVLSGGLAPRGADGPNGLTPMTFLTRMYDALDGRTAFDAVALHPYTFPRDPLDPHPTNTFTSLPDFHELMQERGDGDKQIWITEFGAWTSPLGGRNWRGSVTQQTQADHLVTAFEAARELTWIGPMLWFSYRDRGSTEWDDFARDDNFGLVDQDGVPKAAHDALADLLVGKGSP